MNKFLNRLLISLALTFTLALICQKPVSASSSITPMHLASTYGDPNKAPTYSFTIPVGTWDVTHPVIANDKGYFIFNVSAAGLPSSADLQLYKDPGCTQKVGFKISIFPNFLSRELMVYIPAKGTYYLQLSQKNSFYQTNLTIRPYYYSSSDKVLKSNTWTASYSNHYSNTIFHKINVSKTGYLKVNGFSRENGEKKKLDNVVLYNSRKKPLTESISLNPYTTNYTTYYGVKRGTYYVGVKGTGLYNLRYSFGAVKAKNISSKKRAATLKRNKTAKGLMIAGESVSKANWYKITVPKKRRIKVTMKANADGSFYLSVIAKKRNKVHSRKLFTFNGTSFTKSSSVILPKGTYYIKINKYGKSKGSSGYYRLSWK